MRLFQLHPLLALRTVTCQRLLDGVEQVLVAERLGEKLDCPGFHRLHHHRHVAVASDENDWDVNLGFGQLALEVESAQPRQPHVEHQAGGRVRCWLVRISRADANISTRRPTERMRLWSASRIAASSSITKTIACASVILADSHPRLAR